MTGRVLSRIRPLGLLALAAALTTGLSGCGKKPKFVDPPQGWEANTFPRTYPPAEDGTVVKGRKKPEITPNLGAPNAGSDGTSDEFDQLNPGMNPTNPAFRDTLTNPSNLPYSTSGGSTTP